MENIEQIREHQKQRLEILAAPVVRWLAAWNVHPNLLTSGNVVFSLLAASFVLVDALPWAGVVFLFGSTLDMLDGMLARMTNRATASGAFLDSTVDRICEGVILASIAWWLADAGQTWAVAALVLAMLGSMLTSYTRARAEALGLRCGVGWVTRAERVVLISLGLLTQQIVVTVYLLAVLTLWSAGQRIVAAYKLLNEEKSTAGRR